jgi:hypothetical protein
LREKQADLELESVEKHAQAELDVELAMEKQEDSSAWKLERANPVSTR